MTNSANSRPTFTHEEALQLWATYIKRWGELLYDKIMADAQRCESLDPFEQAYLRAFWQGLAARLDRLNTDPLSVPAKTKDELDSMWKTIALEFDFPPVDEALAGDVENASSSSSERLLMNLNARSSIRSTVMTLPRRLSKYS